MNSLEEAQSNPTPLLVEHVNSMIGLFRAGGFSVGLAHHVAHTMGSRLSGFSQELFVDTQDLDPEAHASLPNPVAATYPYLVEIATAASHDDASVVGEGCDDQYEFEFALDLLLDGSRDSSSNRRSPPSSPRSRAPPVPERQHVS